MAYWTDLSLCTMFSLPFVDDMCILLGREDPNIFHWVIGDLRGVDDVKILWVLFLYGLLEFIICILPLMLSPPCYAVRWEEVQFGVHSIWRVGETIVFLQKQSLVYFLLHFQSRNHNNMQMDLALNSVIQLKQQSQNHPSSHTQIGHLIIPVTKKDSIRLWI